MLQRYDIDAGVCGQRLVCSMVQNAADRVARGSATSADKLVDGLFGWVFRVGVWVCTQVIICNVFRRFRIGPVSRLAAGTLLEPALTVARSPGQRCERQYAGCRLRGTSYELLSLDVFRFA